MHLDHSLHAVYEHDALHYATFQSFGPVDNGINAIAPKKSRSHAFLTTVPCKISCPKILVKQNIIQEQSQFLDSPTHSIQIHQSILIPPMPQANKPVHQINE